MSVFNSKLNSVSHIPDKHPESCCIVMWKYGCSLLSLLCRYILWPDQLSQRQIQYVLWNRFNSVELVFLNSKYNLVIKLTSSSSNTIKSYLKPDLSLSTHLLTVLLLSVNGLCLFSISLVRWGKNSSYSILFPVIPTPKP